MLKRFGDTSLHKHYGINQKKKFQPHKFSINKFCVVSFSKIYNFLKLC